MKESYFTALYNINVNDRTEKKNGLTYLSWAWAWAEVKKLYPNATYNVKRFDNGLPYLFDPSIGYMVFTDVTIDGLTHEMWLPVMDGANKAMLDHPYKYTVKSYGKLVEKTCEKATMFDVNKTIMRCLTKNLAMFGLGLYIYAGEDLPEELDKEDTGEQIKAKEKEQPKQAKQKKSPNEDLQNQIIALAKELGGSKNDNVVKATKDILGFADPRKCEDKKLLEQSLSELQKMEQANKSKENE